jgi:hypothetical protein
MNIFYGENAIRANVDNRYLFSIEEYARILYIDLDIRKSYALSSYTSRIFITTDLNEAI